MDPTSRSPAGFILLGESIRLGFFPFFSFSSSRRRYLLGGAFTHPRDPLRDPPPPKRQTMLTVEGNLTRGTCHGDFNILPF